MSRPLHLLEVSVRWPPETFLRSRFEGLAARGMKVTVASKAVVDPDARLDGVELLPIAGRETPALAQLRPDVVQFEWNDSASRFFALFDAWGCPVVTSCHGNDIEVYPHRPDGDAYVARLREVMRRVDGAVCVSRRLRDGAVELGLDPAAACVIPPGIDLAAFRPPPARTAGEELRVVAVGWLRWMKGFEYAVEAVRRARDRGVPVSLEILGGVPHRVADTEGTRVERAIADLGLTDHVHLRGEASHARVAQAMAAADVFLLSSVSEGLPTVVLEAMASGLPVVATDVGGVREAVTDRVEALVVPARDPGAMAGALARLWRDPALRERMGRAGRRTVERRFSLDRHLDEFVDFYEEVANGAVRAGRPVVSDVPAPPATPSSRGNGSRPLRLVAGGPVVWELGLEYLVHAISVIAESGIAATLRIAGEGDHQTAVAFAAHQLGVTGQVRFEPSTALAAALREADAFIDPAVAESAPTAPAETARALGVPVISTRGDGAVDRRDPHALAAVLAKIERARHLPDTTAAASAR